MCALHHNVHHKKGRVSKVGNDQDANCLRNIMLYTMTHLLVGQFAKNHNSQRMKLQQ